MHAGPLEHDGSLNAGLYPQAKWFIDAVHRAIPGVRVQSWLGDVVEPENVGLHLDDDARRVDQVAVMSYDTSMQLKSHYGGYVAHQTALALEVTPSNVDLLMGAPMYWDDVIGHRGDAETVAAAVRGVRLALGRNAFGRQSLRYRAVCGFHRQALGLGDLSP